MILGYFMEKRSLLYRIGISIARNFLSVSVPVGVAAFIYVDRQKSINYRAKKTAEIKKIIEAEGKPLYCKLTGTFFEFSTLHNSRIYMDKITAIYRV